MGAKTDFVVVGFPKCGTSALMRLLQRMPGLVVERDGDDLEAPFYMSDESADRHEASRATCGERLHGHKFVSYVYSTPALERIARRNPEAVFVVCVRDPEKALASWRAMHRQIAGRDGEGSAHFIHQDPVRRQFYAEASLQQYYEEFARPRLRYAALIRRLLACAPGHRVVVVEQSALASDPDRVLSILAAEFGLPAEAALASGVQPARRAHVGVGDRSGGEADSAMRQELARERALLDELLSELDRGGQARVARPRTSDERAAIRQQIPRSVAVLGTTNGMDPAGYLAALKSHPLVGELSNLSMAASPSSFLHYRLAGLSAGMHDLCLIETLSCDTSVLRAGAAAPQRMADALEAAVLKAREQGMAVAALLVPTRRRDASSDLAHREHTGLFDRLGVPYCDAQAIALELAQRCGREWDSLFRDAAHLQAPLARAMADGFVADWLTDRLPTRPVETGPAHRYRWLALSAQNQATLGAGQPIRLQCEPGEALEALVVNAKGTQTLLQIIGDQPTCKDLRFKTGSERKLAAVSCLKPVREVQGSITLLAGRAPEGGSIEPSYLADRALPATGAIDLAGVILSSPGEPPAGLRLGAVSCAWQPGATQWKLLAAAVTGLVQPSLAP